MLLHDLRTSFQFHEVTESYQIFCLSSSQELRSACYLLVLQCLCLIIKALHPHPRSDMSRILFNIVETDSVRCMETCLKYNRARAPPSASDKAAFTELITWTWNTTRDPDTLLNYEDTLSNSFWLSYRSDQNQDHKITS